MNVGLHFIPSLLAQALVREEEEFITELRHVPEGWAAVLGVTLLLGLCAAVVWMYRREGRVGASQRVRMVLAVLRCAVVVTLGVILLEPVRVRILRQWIDSYAILLVDESSSMDLADTYREAAVASRVQAALGSEEPAPIRRADVVDRLLKQGDRKFLRDLADRNRVRVFTFADEPRLLGTIPAAREGPPPRATVSDAPPELLGMREVPTQFSATGPATNVDRAVRRAVESLGSAPIAGVVLLSDGGFNQGAPPEDVARFARDRQVAIHTVGIGDPASPRNVRVAEILAPENVFKQDPFAVSARFAAQGLDGETIRVELREHNATAGGEGRTVATKEIVVGTEGAMEPARFERRSERVGRFVYTVEIPVLESESVADDNSKQVTVNVIDSRTRVLLVSGGPSWEYSFLSRLLERDESVEVSCWLQSADLSAVRDGNTVIDHLPVLAEELLDYDVIILMDPDLAEFDEEWCRLADTLVSEHGGGLLFAAARPRTPAFLREPSLRALLALLPVTPDPDVDLVLNQIGHYQLSGAPVEVPATSYGHPVLQLADDPVSTKLAWQDIGDIHWHYPVLREKPAATVLLRHGDPRMRNSYGGHVLAAVQFVGAGRTGFVGFDGTWRWRRYGPAVFDRFWIQLVRYLAEGRLLAGTKRGMLLTESDQFALGEAVTVTARLFDERYKPLDRDEVRAEYLVDGDRADFTLTALRDRPGWFEGRFVPDRTGAFHIRLTLPGGAAAEPLEITREIRISRPNLEVLRPQMDRAKLVTLAEQSAGGRYFAVDEMSALPQVIEDLHEEIPVRSRPTTLWDRGTTLAWLITLLAAEWTVRKLSRLL